MKKQNNNKLLNNNFNNQIWIVFAITIFIYISFSFFSTKPVNIDYNRFQKMIKSHDISKIVVIKNQEIVEITLKEEHTAEALKPVLNQIMTSIKNALENTPPELSADLVDMGLVLTGGGALLKNIDKLISRETGLPVQIAEDPLSCVALGTGKALDQEETFSTMLSEY